MQIVGWTVSRRPTASVSRRAGAHIGAAVDDGFAHYTQRWPLRQPTPLPLTTMDTGRRETWGYVPTKSKGRGLVLQPASATSPPWATLPPGPGLASSLFNSTAGSALASHLGGSLGRRFFRPSPRREPHRTGLLLTGDVPQHRSSARPARPSRRRCVTWRPDWEACVSSLGC